MSGESSQFATFLDRLQRQSSAPSVQWYQSRIEDLNGFISNVGSNPSWNADLLNTINNFFGKLASDNEFLPEDDSVQKFFEFLNAMLLFLQRYYLGSNGQAAPYSAQASLFASGMLTFVQHALNIKAKLLKKSYPTPSLTELNLNYVDLYGTFWFFAAPSMTSWYCLERDLTLIPPPQNGAIFKWNPTSLQGVRMNQQIVSMLMETGIFKDEPQNYYSMFFANGIPRVSLAVIEKRLYPYLLVCFLLSILKFNSPFFFIFSISSGSKISSARTNLGEESSPGVTECAAESESYSYVC